MDIMRKVVFFFSGVLSPMFDISQILFGLKFFFSFNIS